MPRSRPPYPEEFRREAVELVRGGRSAKASLRAWVQSVGPIYVVKRYQLDHRARDDELTSDKREELRELRRKVRQFEQEREILKRATALFVRESETQ